MTSKDKLIGVALILIGLGFIALGVVFGMKPVATTNNNLVYTEQQNDGTIINNDQNQNEVKDIVDVYTENNAADDESTRYIY